LRKFVIALVAATLLIVLVSHVLLTAGWLTRLPSFFYTTLILLLTTTGLLTYFLLNNNRGFFTQLYLLTIVVKIIAYVGYLFAVVFLDKASAFPNVVFFMIAYVIFTAIELAFLYGKITR
jgi:hypothetical protein